MMAPVAGFVSQFGARSREKALPGCFREGSLLALKGYTPGTNGYLLPLGTAVVTC